MKAHLFLVFIFPALSWTQSRTGDARTSGSCSPAVTGNSNEITVTCNGLSKDKADEMVHLMNSILIRQLDPKTLYTELDHIYGAVNDIGAAINPLGNAPPEVIARVKLGQRMQQDCYGLSTEWSQATLRAQQQFQMELLNSVTKNSTAGMAVSDSGSPVVNTDFAKQYAQSLAPQLLAWRSRIEQQAGFFRSQQDWSNPVEDSQMHFICQGAHQLAKRYSFSQSADFQLVRDSKALLSSCDALADRWSKAHGHEIPTRGFQMPDVRALTNAVNADFVARYKDNLESQLSSWRDDNLKSLPNHPLKDYGHVTDPMQLNTVCADVANIWLSYQQTAAEYLRKSRAFRKQ